MDSKNISFSTKKTINLSGDILDLSKPVAMGIVNVTPDSFYEGSRVKDEKLLLTKVGQMLADGASIIDIGAYSTRPGAKEITVKEEVDRLLSAVKIVLKEYKSAKISVDTFRASVAEAAVGEGACLINDISGGTLDERMFETVGALNVPYVLMHMKGTPQTMKKLTSYEAFFEDIIDYFQKKVNQLYLLGVRDIIIDPGFGFAKTIDQNFDLLKNLEIFKLFNLPILVGVSRKSMIWRSLEITPEGALNGTSILNFQALLNHSSILRVHDIKEAVEVIELYKLLKN